MDFDEFMRYFGYLRLEKEEKDKRERRENRNQGQGNVQGLKRSPGKR